MSAKLGTLTLDLVTKIGNFVGPIKDAEKQTKVSFEKMRGYVNSYGVIAAASAASLGVGVYAMANGYANATNELKNFASISRSTTQEFQKMAAGAQTVGISQDNLSAQLKDFNEKLGEFTTNGTGGAVDFFEKIAIKTEGSAEGAKKLALEMQKLSGPQALQLYVDKLEEAGVSQQQMSFYLENMASDTTNLIPLLKNGGEGFRFWAEEAEKAGVIIDEAGIQKAAEFKVQLALLEMQVTGAKNQFVQGLIPSLVSVGDVMTNATAETNLLKDAGEDLGYVFKGVAGIALGVYASVTLLTNAIAGLTVDAVNARKIVEGAAASEQSSWFDKLPSVKWARTAIIGATITQAPNSGTSMAAEDNSKVIQDIDTSLRTLFSGTVNEAIKSMAQLQQGTAGVTTGMDEWAKKQSGAAKAVAAHNKALAEQNRILEQQKRDREQISKAYASDFQNLVWDEKDQQDLVKGAGFSVVEQAKYLALVQKRFDAESAEYFKTLNLELNQYKWTEEKKLEYTYQMDREIAENDVKIADEVRESKLKFLDEQYAYQKKQLEINQAKELLQVKQLWMSAGDYARDYYALVRAEILNTASYSPEMKDALVKQANIQQGVDQNAEREQVWGDFQNRFGAQKSPYQKDIDLLQEAFRQKLIDEKEYQQQRLRLQLTYGAQYTSDFAGMMMGLVDSSSGAYAILGGIQKGAALYATILNGYTTISAAWASAPFPYNLPAVATATMETGVLQAAVSALTPAGYYATGGLITGKGTGTSDEIPIMASNREFMFRAAAVEKLGLENLYYMNRTGELPRTFAEGGAIALDAPKVLNTKSSQMNEYREQAKATQAQTIDNQIKVMLVDNRDDLMNSLYGTGGQKVVVHHIKRNKSQIKALLG